MGENKYLVIFVHRTRRCERVSVQFNKCGAILPAFPVGSATLNEDGHRELRKNTFPKDRTPSCAPFDSRCRSPQTHTTAKNTANEVGSFYQKKPESNSISRGHASCGSLGNTLQLLK